MRLLLTSAGVANASILEALVDLLGKPIAEADALCIPTAEYGHPALGPGVSAWRFISGRSQNPMVDLGWRSVGVLELTALPSIDEDRWVPLVREADVLLVAGGDALYLCHWMRESGLAELLGSLHETVWVGLSAGSMVLTPGSVRTSSSGDRRPVRTTARWGSSTSRSSRTWPRTACPGTPWPRRRSGRPRSVVRRTRSTTRQPSRWSTVSSRWSPKALAALHSRVGAGTPAVEREIFTKLFSPTPVDSPDFGA